MTHNLKGLGLALIAVLAMGAVMASAAQAEAKFTGYEGTPPNQTYVHTNVEGTQIGTNVFEVTAGTLELKCTTASLTGTSVAGDEATLTIIPSYSNCHALAAVFTAHVNMNGCDYLFHITKKETEHKYSGPVDLVCPAGKRVHIEVTKLAGGTKCTVTVPGQNNLGPVYYTNITPETETEETTKIAMSEPRKPKDVVLDANVNNIISTTSAPSGKPSDCAVAALGAHTGGTYVGEVTFKGLNTKGEQINLTVSGENPSQAEAKFTGYEGTPPNQTYVHTNVEGTQIGTNVFEVTAGTLELKCTTASLTGTSVAGDEATLTIIPSYSNCHALAAVFTAHVNMNGCDYLFHITKKETEHKYSGHVDLICPAGKSVEIEVTKLAGGRKCTVTESAQTGLEPVYYTNITPETETEETTKIAMSEPRKPKDVVLDANVNNIISTTSAPSGKPSDCAVATLGAHVGGTYVGEVTLKGSNTQGEQINLTVSGENP